MPSQRRAPAGSVTVIREPPAAHAFAIKLVDLGGTGCGEVMEPFPLPAYEAIRKTLGTPRSGYRHPRLIFAVFDLGEAVQRKDQTFSHVSRQASDPFRAAVQC